ncbi:MAG: RagB/SusD family nutrient uptake outer membrane protein [Bacteroidota bacterium]
MKNIKSTYIITLAVVVILSLTSCLKDLNRKPFYEASSATIYEDPNNYIHVLAKLYAGLAVSGQSGPAGNPDLAGIDEGFSQYLRQYWQLQELPTDEAVIAWNDGTIQELNKMTWSSQNEFVTVLYNRIMYQITLCNEFIRQTSDENLDKRNFSESVKNTLRAYRAEARFLKALSLWHGMDLYGNIPDITNENNYPGSEYPKQINRKDLFIYIESELTSIENEITPVAQSEYGRANQAAVWSLLARMYLNAEAHIQTPRYTDAITYCNKVISSGYTLEPKYRNLFLADNNLSKEVIFPICFDGINTRTYGGTCYLVHAPVGGGSWSAADSFGISAGGWFGLRSTLAFYNQFPDTIDSRYMFFRGGQTNDTIKNLGTFSQGIGIQKFRNITSTGAIGSDPVNFPDTDFPMFRLAEIYLTYAEAALKPGSGGDQGIALGYINEIRLRAYNNDPSYTLSSLTQEVLENERARELYWEGHRRTDLIRYGKFTDNQYLWPWKGGVQNGQSVANYYRLYPIPTADLIANPNLVQNTGY